MNHQSSFSLRSFFQPVDLTQRTCWKTLLVFAFPIIVSYLLQQAARRMARFAAHAAALPRGRAGRGHGTAAPDPDAGTAGAPPERLGPADGGRPRPGAGAPGPPPDHGRDGQDLRPALRPRGPSPLPRAHPGRRDAAHQHHQPSRLWRRLFLLLAGPASGAPHQLPQPGIHPGRGPQAGGPVPPRSGGHLRRGRPHGQHVAGPLRPG